MAIYSASLLGDGTWSGMGKGRREGRKKEGEGWEINSRLQPCIYPRWRVLECDEVENLPYSRSDLSSVGFSIWGAMQQNCIVRRF